MPNKRSVTPSTTGLRYIGDGTYINGVPARDLSPDEAARYADLIAASEQATGIQLYQTIVGKADATPAEPVASDSEDSSHG